MLTLLRQAAARLRATVRRDHDAREFARELEAHHTMLEDRFISRGMSPERARRAARLALGNPAALGEAHQAVRGLPFLDAVSRDVRYALRLFRRAPMLSVTIVATLGLVIGATTAVFSLADAILFRPLPYPSPDRLALVARQTIGSSGSFTSFSISGQMWEVVRDWATGVDAAPYMTGATGVNFVSGRAASFVQQQRVAAGFFRVLGVAPLLGREFTREEDLPGGPAVAVIAYGFWQRALGGRPDAVGQQILLRGEAYEIVGVMPAGFRSTAEADLWTPLRPSRSGEGAGTNYRLAARLKDGVDWARASGELNAVGDERLGAVPPGATRRTLTLAPFQAALTASARQPLLLLSAAVTGVLLVACVNIAALLLSRGGSRQMEIATRMALGSSRAGIVRQLMVESALLAVFGGAAGLVVGWLGLEALKTIGSATYAEWKSVSLDWRAVIMTGAVALLTSLVFGVVPAVQAGRLDVRAALVSGGSRGIAGGSWRWPRRILVVAEIAVSVALLVTAGLLMREFSSLRSLSPGFEPAGLYTASVSIQDARYPDASAANRLIDSTLDVLGRTPGITAAAVSQRVPFETLLNTPFQVVGRPVDPAGQTPIASVAYVTPDFFAALAIPIVSGRTLAVADRKGAPEAVVVNEMFARVYFADAPALGRRLDLGAFVGMTSAEIVGIAGAVQQQPAGFSVPGMRAGPIMTTPTIYVPAAQAGDGLFRWFSPAWTVRATSAGEATAALRRAVAAVDPLLPVGDVRSMAEVAARATAEARLLTMLVGVLAAAALLVAAIGVHGLIAHGVSERTRELGIRLALGATPQRTIARIVLGGMVLGAVGAAVGGALSLPATRLVEASLTTVGTRDPTTYGSVALVLFAVAAIASLAPALRLLRLDLSRTLRE